MQTTQITRNAFSNEGAGFSFKSAKKEIEYEELNADNEWVDDDLNTPPKKLTKVKQVFSLNHLKIYLIINKA